MQTKTRPTQLRYRPRLGGFRLGLFTILAVLLSAGLAMAGTEVTSCGQVVSGSAFLSGDLDCSSSGTDGVVLAGGSLDLRGFTITADSSFGSCGVLCTRSCKVVSTPPGGTITGAGFGICDDAFDADLARSVRLNDLLVTGNIAFGVFTQEAGVRIANSTVSNNGIAVEAQSSTRGRVRVVTSTITSNGRGVVANHGALIRDSVISGNTNDGASVSTKLTVKNSQIIGNGTYGASSDKNRFVDSVISGNGEEGIRLFLGSERLKVLRTTIDGNGSDGVFLAGVRTLIRDSTITNNGGHGLNRASRKLKVVGSTVSDNRLNGVDAPGFAGCTVALQFVGSTISGNGSDPSCGVSVTCADIASCAPPSLSASTCDTSYDTNSGFPGLSWGVCALD